MQLNLTHPIKLAFCDLDGTLLDEHSAIAPATRQAIARAEAAGLHVSFATGRAFPMLADIARAAGITAPLVTCNGAQIVDPVTGKLISGSSLDPAAIEPTLRALDARGVEYSLLGIDCCLFGRSTNPRLPYCLKSTGDGRTTGLTDVECLVLDGDYSRLAGHRIAKILLNEQTPGKAEAACRAVIDSSVFECYRSSPTLIEIMPIGIDKGEGVRRVAAACGVPMESVAVFGDYDNDLPMLRIAGFPVAMGNGTDAVKAAARYICETNTENGVAKTLDRMVEANRAFL